MKKALCFLLSLVMILSIVLLVSCNENEKKEDETVTTKLDKEEETSSPYLDELPETLNFGNEEISFLVAETTVAGMSDYSSRSINTENYVVGTNYVDDAIYQRNAKVEERLSVVITHTTMATAITESAVYTNLQSGVADYDVISGWMTRDNPMATKGIILDYNKLADYDADYIDLSKSYWAKNYTNAVSYQGKTYWITGDLSLRFSGGTYCTFVNTELYANAIEGQSDGNGGTYSNIYKLVEDGKWTLDNLITMSAMIFEDSGKTEGKADLEDRLGIIVETHSPLLGVAVGAGCKFSATDPGGNPYISLSDNAEWIISFAEKANRLFNSGNALLVTTTWSTTEMTKFANGSLLFVNDQLLQAETYLQDMETYGIIPSPKLDETQTEYASYMEAGLSSYGIYAICENIPAAAATLEAMASISKQVVSPAYYDKALKFRYTRDEQSAEMIDLIHENVYFDFISVWKYAICSSWDITTLFNTIVPSPSKSASTIKLANTEWENGLDALLESLDEIEMISK